MPETFRELSQGNPLSASQMQPYLQRVRELSPLTGDGRFIEVARSPHGTTIRFLGAIAPPGGEWKILSVQSDAARYATYAARIGKPIAGADGTFNASIAGTVTFTDLYEFPSDDSCWFINLAEVGFTTNVLGNPRYVIGFSIGTALNDVPLYVGWALDVVECP